MKEVCRRAGRWRASGQGAAWSEAARAHHGAGSSPKPVPSPPQACRAWLGLATAGHCVAVTGKTRAQVIWLSGHVPGYPQWGRSYVPVPPWRVVLWPQRLCGIVEPDFQSSDPGCHSLTPLCRAVPVGETGLEVVLSSAWCTWLNTHSVRLQHSRANVENSTRPRFSNGAAFPA